MACCHSLTYIKEELVGDPLEIQMFESTSWALDEEHREGNSQSSTNDVVLASVRPQSQSKLPQDYELAILLRFDFASKLQRMSVVVRNKASNGCFAYVKGSPEKIASLCEPGSLPADYVETLAAYTQKGYRVIAFAVRQLDEETFLGL